MTSEEFERTYPKYRKVIQAIARKYAHSDDELCADLEQEGALRLLQLDLSRIRKNPSAFIRTSVRNAIIDYLRNQDPRMYESLTYRLSCGDQLETLDDGEVLLLSRRPDRPNLYDEDEEIPFVPMEEAEDLDELEF